MRYYEEVVAVLVKKGYHLEDGLWVGDMPALQSLVSTVNGSSEHGEQWQEGLVTELGVGNSVVDRTE